MVSSSSSSRSRKKAAVRRKEAAALKRCFFISTALVAVAVLVVLLLQAGRRAALMLPGNDGGSHVLLGNINSTITARSFDSVEWNQTSFVPKQQFSTTTRFLFVAGLGGTGHHGWLAVLKKSGVCRGSFKAEQALKELWMGQDLRADDHAARVQEILTQTKEYVERRTTSGSGGIVCLNAVLPGGHLFSYPENNSPRHHPNVYTLARLAEEVGIDLRLVVLHRHPAPQLVSLSVHRQFLALPGQAHQMTNQGALLNAELLLLDPQFYVCAGFDAVWDLRHVIAEHVAGGMVTTTATTTDAGVVPSPDEANNSLLLSKSIKEHYRARMDDPRQAWSEIHKFKDGQKIQIKLVEMHAYYSYLKDIVCRRGRQR